MSAFMAQSGNLVVLRRCRRRAGRFASTRRGSSCAARSRASAPTASRRRCAPSIIADAARAAGPRRHRRRRPPSSRRYGSARKLYNFNIDNAGLLRTGHERRPRQRPGPCRASRRPSRNDVNAEIRRAAATGIYDIRGGGAKRRVPHFDDLLFLGASISPLSARRLSREMRDRRHARHPLRQEADQAGHPDHHRRHELRLAVGPGQGGARPRRHRRRHLDHHRRRRHDRGRARPFRRRWSISTCPRATA